MVISEKLVPHFKPGKALREAVDRRVGELRAAAAPAGEAAPGADPRDAGDAR